MVKPLIIHCLKELMSWKSCVSNSSHWMYFMELANVFSLILTTFCPHTGILTLTITNPIWVTKTRLVLQYNADPTGKQYKGMIDALVKIYRHEGVAGLYRVSHQCVM